MTKTDINMRETLTRTRESEYFTRDGLRTLTGLDENKWALALLKELIDNALDSIDECGDKRIDVIFDRTTLAIFDSGPGTSKDTLDMIHDFDVYVSSKRDFRTPTRGMQGNALKTIIGICHLNGYTLTFVGDEKQYQYTLNHALRHAGIIRFETTASASEHIHARWGIIVASEDGFTFTDELGYEYLLGEHIIKDTVLKYYLCNPDVMFTVNGATFDAVADPIKRTEKTFVHWYDYTSFYQLLQAIVFKDPDRTVRDFALKFSGTQRLRLRFP